MLSIKNSGNLSTVAQIFCTQNEYKRGLTSSGWLFCEGIQGRWVREYDCGASHKIVQTLYRNYKIKSSIYLQTIIPAKSLVAILIRAITTICENGQGNLNKQLTHFLQVAQCIKVNYSGTTAQPIEKIKELQIVHQLSILF